ncbi:hypothetical protein B0H34DRAFT_697049 [Crassisporium funariophilum]|nr:hypothetical protein B0H34DRAFT_697049 [Crassisporium funariophilum]
MARNKVDQCNTEPLDWALFILTIISTHVTWWLLPLPRLYTHGFRTYIHDVSWDCLRLQAPSYVAYLACGGQERANWQTCYYTGIKKPTTRFGDIKAFVKDSLVVVSTCLALYRLCAGGSDKDLSGLNSSLWMYPSLPVAIYGLFISIFARTQVKLWIVAVSSLTFLILLAIAIALIIAFTYGRGIWIPCTMLMLFMTLPTWAIAPKLLAMAIFFSTFARIGGMVIGAVSPGAYFPFCALRGWGFAGPVLALALIALILGVYGLQLKPRSDTVEVVEEMKEIP